MPVHFYKFDSKLVLSIFSSLRNSLIYKLLSNRYYLFIFAFILSIHPSNLKAQDNNYSWNQLVSWDGFTHWTKYMIISPKYFGPNALPIPELKSGLVEPKSFFDVNLQGHYSTGDKTTNAYLKYLHSFSGKIAVEVSVVPIEYYSVSSSIRDKRKIRNEDPKGFSFGDINLGTIIQLVKDHQFIPDITYGMYFRTASGGKLDDARFTDFPGYYFDLTFGKNIKNPPGIVDKVRWYASLGFYAWQTNLDDYLQNDAISSGFGLLVKKNNYEINSSVSGYYGYISYKNEPVVRNSENPYIYTGDQPFIYKLSIDRIFSNQHLYLSLQKGLHDFDYTSLIIGMKIFPNF